MNRRQFMLVVTAGSTSLLSGCITRNLMADTTYTENVSSLLISTDRKNIVFLGKEYHYIFDCPETLARALYASFHPRLEARIEPFRIGRDGFVRGNYTVWLKRSANEQDRLDARNAGFSPERNGDLALKDHLIGKRYANKNANAITLAANSGIASLNRPYLVSVFEDQDPATKNAKSLLTPITIAADGTLLIGVMTLVVVSLPLVFVAMVTQESARKRQNGR